jgi:predicted AAA+ superfamily ATPase
MRYIQRQIEDELSSHFHRGKALLIFGPRQVGKTTMVRHLVNGFGEDVCWLNGDDSSVRMQLDDITTNGWKRILGNSKFLVIDEAQRIRDIGWALKLVTDELPDIQVIATGSSSFDLKNKTSEPLTGRKFDYKLLPFSFYELCEDRGYRIEVQDWEQRLRFGSYPRVIGNPGNEERELMEIVNGYLYKDILALDGVKDSYALEKLLRALALQVGSEINASELSGLVGIDNKTIERYIDILQKCYIVFKVGAYSRNLRNELKKRYKVYFFDLGIRNAVIGNFLPLTARTDAGHLWENYLILERLKKQANIPFSAKYYFWRTVGKGGKEIDYLEESADALKAWEIKLHPESKAKIPLTFQRAYPKAETATLTPRNYGDFLLD